MRRLARAHPFGTALGPEGFGANVTGGAGGTVYAVTNTNDTGAGSFRQAVADANANSPNPSIVDIQVGGFISLNSTVTVTGDNITITGRNAPTPFIIRGNHNPLMNHRALAQSSTSNNLLLEHLRLHRGIGNPGGSVQVLAFFGSNVLVRHCSLAWGMDTIVDVFDAVGNFTFDYCLFYEPLSAAHHFESGGFVNHPLGISINRPGANPSYKGRVSILRSIFVHAEERVPGTTLADTEYINMMVYNWGNPNNGGRIVDDTFNAACPANFIGCYYMQGNDSEILSRPITGHGAHTVVYINDCVWQKRDFTQDRSAVNFIRSGNPKATPNVWSPATPNNPTALRVDEAWQHLRPRVGAFLPRRSVSDIRVLKHVENAYKKVSLQGEIIDSPTLFDHQNVNTNPNRAKYITEYADWPDAL